jgi:hypothetical protein
MDYKIVKYMKKRKCNLETYEPERRLRVRSGAAVPFFIGVCSKFAFLGGFVSLIFSSMIMAVKGYFHAEEKVKKFSWEKKRVVEIRVRKRK